jgi:flagellar hook-associated protein 3 FlgL
VQTLAVSAGNAALDDTQRKYIATELQSNFDELLGLANTRDAAGNFLFAGFRATAQPFNATPTGATYSGDQGQRMLQIGPSRQISLNDSGINIFERVRTGNGTFVTAAGAGNKGGGIADLGSVTDPAALTNHDYRIDFHVSGGATTYDVIDTTAAAAVSSGNAYTDGASIAFQGLQFQVKGAPADGDSFTVAPSGNASIFSTMRDLINVLNQPATDTAGRANLSNGLIRAGAGLNSMLDNVSTVRASLGTRLKELDSLDSAGSDRDLQYSQALSDLQDVDYAKASSDLSQQQMTLQAAQKSFVAVSGLSLFSFI